VPNEEHRVIAIEMPASDEPAEGQRLAMWEWITRGIGRRPLVTEIGTVLYALVPDKARGGGWPELRQALLSHDLSPRPLVAVGTSVAVTDIPSSRAQADELIGMLRTGLVRQPVAVYEDLWHLLVLSRMAGAATDAGVAALGPLAVLREHDRGQGTDYQATLHAWLRHPGDPRQAGRELRVHPNTFRYRMKRIGQLVEVDLDDPDVRSALLVQLLAERWAQHG
jgi:DNA-binding PucR family transcriptional regulator